MYNQSINQQMPGQFKFSLRMKVALKNRNFNGKMWGTFHSETGYLEDVRIGQTYQKRSDQMPTCIMALKRWRETFKVNFPDRRRTCFSHPRTCTVKCGQNNKVRHLWHNLRQKWLTFTLVQGKSVRYEHRRWLCIWRQVVYKI